MILNKQAAVTTTEKKLVDVSQVVQQNWLPVQEHNMEVLLPDA